MHSDRRTCGVFTEDTVDRVGMAAAMGTESDGSVGPLHTVEGLRAANERLRAELIAYQRLALLGNMAAMVAHELNNVMTPLIVRAESAANSNDPKLMRQALQKSLVQAQRAMSISNHLLGLARNAPSSATGEFLLAEAVQEAVETSARPFDKDGIDLQIHVPKELKLHGRLDLFTQVLLNLLLNARNAMKGMRGKLVISAKLDGPVAQIDVRDSGKGIPADQLQGLFNPFLAAAIGTAVDDWHAVGLGLNVCRTIASQQGATIQALANDGPGCTFRLRWPAA